MSIPLAHENPFQWLGELQKLAKQQVSSLPQPEVVQETWRGIAFRLNQYKLLVNLKDINEILHCPKAISRVPGARPWIHGIANIRGQLLPVIDLKACLGGPNTVLKNSTRLLIMNHANIFSGVLVDEVLGIKHFSEDERIDPADMQAKEDWIAGFIREGFRQEREEWGVFDMLMLSKSRQFLDAAA